MLYLLTAVGLHNLSVTVCYTPFVQRLSLQISRAFSRTRVASHFNRELG